MMDYFVTAGLISLSLLLTTTLLKNAPARLNFYLLIFALVTWCIPWQQLPFVQQASESNFLALDLDDFISVETTSTQTTEVISPISQANSSEQTTWSLSSIDFSLADAFTLSLLIGLVLFIFRAMTYMKIIRHFYLNSTESKRYKSITGDYLVRITELNTPALATGLFIPVIWLDKTMQQRGEINSVIQHEVNHLKQADTAWIWLICLIESLFWWNPVCLYLAKKSKQQLELSCDEKCFTQLKQRYQEDLASLLLSKMSRSTQHSFAAPMLNIKQSNNFNMQRIKLLNKEKTMKAKYIGIALTGILFCGYTAASIGNKTSALDLTAQSEQTAQSGYQAQLEQLVELSKNARSEDTAELKLIFQNILAWQNNRAKLSGFEETQIKLYAFTMVNNLLQRLEQHNEILTTYYNWYKDDANPPAFLYNHVANAYLNLGQPQQALEALTKLQAEVKSNFQPASKLTLALTYAKLKNDVEALAVLNTIKPEDIKNLDQYKYLIYKELGDSKSMALMEHKDPSLSEVQMPKMVSSSPVYKLI